MKKLAAELLFGKNAMLSGLIAISIVAAIALGCSCGKQFGDLANAGKNDNSTTTSNTSTDKPSKADASTGDVPTDRQAQEIARTTVLDFNDAIQSGDFSDFHGTMSQAFQKQASPEKLKSVFKAFIDAKIDFKEVRNLQASFNPSPSVESSLGIKTLRLKGVYQTSPRKTNFDLKYIPEDDDWKLISIEINTKDQ